jgi:hypothetical protein
VEDAGKIRYKTPVKPPSNQQSKSYTLHSDTLYW